jgi:hypothetical protein
VIRLFFQPQLSRYPLELLQRGLQIIHNFRRKHTLRMVASDRAGNTAEASIEFTVK